MSEATATERVRAAIASGAPPDRKSIEHALRETFGISARQAKRFAAEGAKALGASETPDVSDVADRLAALERAMRV
jgi:hypothetical protein